MTGLRESLPLLLAAGAGAMVAVALREALLATPAALGWLARAVEPLRRAEREGYDPDRRERRRLAALGTTALTAAGLLAGPGPAPLAALAGPSVAGWVIARRRARYRERVERAIPAMASALADALAAGRPPRTALAGVALSLEGPAAVEMAQLGADLELGASMGEALDGLRLRLRSPRVDRFAAALRSGQLGGGDLSAVLRRFAEGAADRDRAAAEARSATAQARFTGALVVAMPSGAALFAELVRPGFVSGLFGNPAAATLLALAGVLQMAGFVAIRRLGRVAEA